MLGLPSRVECGDYCSFTDESDLTARYMVIGGITCGTSFVPDLEATLNAFRARMPFGDRLEWKAITKKNVGIFEELIEEFCRLNSEHLVDFHALVVDMEAFDHHRFNDGDREISFDKMLFQSFHALHKRYPGCERIRCFHGNRDARYPIENLRGMLNNRTTFTRSGRIYMPYAQVQHLPVKESVLLQLADLLIGCVGCKWNARKGHIPGSPKDRVASHLERECPTSALAEKTPFAMRHFDIWKMRSLRV